MLISLTDTDIDVVSFPSESVICTLQNDNPLEMENEGRNSFVDSEGLSILYLEHIRNGVSSDVLEENSWEITNSLPE